MLLQKEYIIFLTIVESWLLTLGSHLLGDATVYNNSKGYHIYFPIDHLWMFVCCVRCKLCLLFSLGVFKTEYQGQLPIVISPCSGTVKAKSSVIIKVDFCADQSQIVDEVAR